MQRKIKIFSCIGIILVLLILIVHHISTSSYSLEGNRIKSVFIGKKIFKAEVVESEHKMQKGLGGRDKLCENCGMLFSFPKDGKYAFWMKDMQFSLDILWILDHKIVHIEKNVQPSFEGILSPVEDADNVLEINAGIIDKAGLNVDVF